MRLAWIPPTLAAARNTTSGLASRDEPLGLGLPAKIDLLGGRRHELADRLPFQPAHQRRAHQAAVSRHPDPLAGQVKHGVHLAVGRRELVRSSRPEAHLRQVGFDHGRHQLAKRDVGLPAAVRRAPSTGSATSDSTSVGRK